MEQVGIIQSGYQLWSKNSIACVNIESQNGEEAITKIAFCSSLAVYVHNVQTGTLERVLAGYDASVRGVVWSPYDPNFVVTCSKDGKLTMWDLGLEKRLSTAQVKQVPVCMSWLLLDGNEQDDEFSSLSIIILATSHGSIIAWSATKSKHRKLVSRALRPLVIPGKPSSTELAIIQHHSPVVLRCNTHKSSSLIACGYKDGRVDLILNAIDENTKPPFFYPPNHKTKDKNPVADIQWDPLSPYYLLVANGASGLYLWDCTNPEAAAVMQSFQTTESILSIAWQPWAPGSFMTVQEKAKGVIQIWNVSQKASTSSLQVAPGSNPVGLVTAGSLTVVPMATGDIHVYDARLKKNLMKTLGCHRETIFDVKFSPDSPFKFATCSYDGTVKVWNFHENKEADEIECLATFKHRKKDSPVTYGITWSPAEYGLIAACTSDGYLSVWSLKQQSQLPIDSSKIHSAAIYKTRWNFLDSKFIACSSGDKTCTVSTIRPNRGNHISVAHRLKHPDMVFGCEWCPIRNTWLATGCQDGAIRVWEFERETVVYILESHRGKVFNIAWNAINPSQLASASDDKTIGVWHVPLVVDTALQETIKVKPLQVFFGHAHNVRALLWSPEIPWILMSGSWDGTIRVWNVELGSEATCIRDHQADVYGLDAHPSRPFCILSSSRDSTIRVWRQRTPHQIHRCMNEMIIATFQGKPSESFSHFTSILKGALGTSLCTRIVELSKKSQGVSSIDTTEEKRQLATDILLFFYSGYPDLANLLQLFKNEENSQHFLKVRATHSAPLRLNDVEYVISGQCINHVTKLMRSNKIREACEFLIEKKHWEKALTLASGVSVEYWKEKTLAYSKFLLGQGDEHGVMYALAAGDQKSVISYYEKHQLYEEALAVVPEATHTLENKGACNPKNQNIILRVAVTNLERGAVIGAACCLLSLGDMYGAIQCLVIGGFEALAYAGCMFRNIPIPRTALEAMIRTCELDGNIDTALHLCRQSRDRDIETFLFCARANPTTDFRRTHGLRDEEQCIQSAKDMEYRRNVSKSMQLSVLCASSDPSAMHKAIIQILERLHEIFELPSWNFIEARELLRVAHAIPLENTPCSEDQIHTLLVYSFFVASFDAAWLGYVTMIPLLCKCCRDLISMPGCVVPLDLAQIYNFELKIRSRLFSRSIQSLELWHVERSAIIQLCKEFLAKYEESGSNDAEESESNVDIENLCVRVRNILGRTETAHYNQHKTDANIRVAHTSLNSNATPCGNTRMGNRSVLTGRLIRGPVIVLENPEQCMGFSEALTWSSLTPYSPLLTGQKIFPRFQSSYSPSRVLGENKVAG